MATHELHIVSIGSQEGGWIEHMSLLFSTFSSVVEAGWGAGATFRSRKLPPIRKKCASDRPSTFSIHSAQILSLSSVGRELKVKGVFGSMVGFVFELCSRLSLENLLTW